MDETFHFIINGISVGILLGTNGPENMLILCYLSYLIFAAFKTIYPTLLPYHLFPSALSKIKRHFDINKLISVKKIR
jgi:hypothetical protein